MINDLFINIQEIEIELSDMRQIAKKLEIQFPLLSQTNVEIKCFIQDGEAISVNAYLSRFSRIYGNFIDATKVSNE